MATTNTTTFSVSTADIIAGAMRICGRLGAGASPTAEDNTNCLFALNLIIKGLNVAGYQIFAYKQISATLVAATNPITIGPVGATITAPRPVRIAQAWIRDVNDFDQPLEMKSRSDYNLLSDKTTPGKPLVGYYDAQTVAATVWDNKGTLYLWPVPTAGWRIYLSYQAPLQDAGATTTQFELPQEWFLALQWALAAEIAMSYSVNLQKVQMIQARASAYTEAMTDFNREEGDVQFTVDQQMGAGRGI